MTGILYPDYNLTSIISSPDLATLAVGTNSILGGYYYGWFILFAVGLTVFLYLKSKGYPNGESIAAALWLDGLLSMLLRAMGLVDNYTLWAFVIAVPLVTFIMYLVQE